MNYTELNQRTNNTLNYNLDNGVCDYNIILRPFVYGFKRIKCSSNSDSLYLI